MVETGNLKLEQNSSFLFVWRATEGEFAQGAIKQLQKTVIADDASKGCLMLL